MFPIILLVIWLNGQSSGFVIQIFRIERELSRLKNK